MSDLRRRCFSFYLIFCCGKKIANNKSQNRQWSDLHKRMEKDRVPKMILFAFFCMSGTKTTEKQKQMNNEWRTRDGKMEEEKRKPFNRKII